VPELEKEWIEYFIYVCLVISFATVSCLLTLTTKTVVPSTYRISTLDENLAAVDIREHTHEEVASPEQPSRKHSKGSLEVVPPMIYYSASGSGVAEVKVILSGFVLHGFLGLKTLIVKTLALILSVASGLSLGKEGPFVHIAACIGNISCRLFSKYDHNDGKRREILSAAAASGVAVAFGAPIGGVLFSLEEASYFFPAKTLFRTFFCCITAALSLKFLNPYGTNKIVMFEVRYLTDWEFFEMVPFIALGILGGATGAIFIKASRFWARSFRRIQIIRRWPLLEVVLVALITGLVSYWNTYTKSPVAKLLLNLASPCDDGKSDEMGLCPEQINDIMGVVQELMIGFVIKGFLTIITFGIVSGIIISQDNSLKRKSLIHVLQKLPAGIYVPSMVVGGLLGRIVGHLVQWLVLRFPNAAIFGSCASHVSGASCITPGVYALIAAGATMCGVTRLSVALAVILFELTGSLDYVLPFSLSVLVAKWTADALEPLSIYVRRALLQCYPYSLTYKISRIF
jgi:chloride channel 3/4/5